MCPEQTPTKTVYSIQDAAFLFGNRSVSAFKKLIAEIPDPPPMIKHTGKPWFPRVEFRQWLESRGGGQETRPTNAGAPVQGVEALRHHPNAGPVKPLPVAGQGT